MQVSIERFLVAGEGEKGHRCRHAEIHAQHSRIDLFPELTDRPGAVCIQAGTIGKRRTVRDLNRFGEILDTYDRQQRSKNLILPDGHTRLYTVEDGRAQEVTFAGRRAVLPAVAHQLRLFRESRFNIGNRPFLIRLADNRTQEDTVLLAVPDFKSISRLYQAVYQFISDRLMHNDYGAGHAALARRAESRSDNILHRIIKVSVRKHNRMILGSGQSLHPLAAGRPLLIYIFRHRL
ncbi:hypothetical protein D3C75_829640 [compost metagenome]